MVDELFGRLYSDSDNQYYDSANENPRITIISIWVPVLFVRVANQSLDQYNDSDNLVDLMEMFDFLCFEGVKYPFPDVKVDDEYQNRYSYEDLGGWENCQTIEDEIFDEHDEPIFRAHV